LLVGFIVASASIAGAQQANAPADHSQHEQHAATPEAGAPHAASSMHEHMQKMQEQMASIRAAEDPAVRQRLMDEHMQSMREHMQMMARDGERSSEPNATRCAGGDMDCRMREMQSQNTSMQRDMHAMQERMSSMQQMLEQMLEHQRAAEEPRRRERAR
jgi:hypothetical protein